MSYTKFEIAEVRDVKTSEGRTFKAYKTYKADGRKIDLKFVTGTKNIPLDRCYIVVDDANWNVDENRRYPCIWVKNAVEKIIPIEFGAKAKEGYGIAVDDLENTTPF